MAIDKHAHEPRHCVAGDIIKAKAETADDQVALDEFLRDADAYLKPFVAPVVIDGKSVCFHCGSELDAFKQALGVGAAIEWGLVNGEGRCSGMPHHDKPCGWPYRGIHRATRPDGSELFTLSNFFLAYHPDEVSERGEEKAA